MDSDEESSPWDSPLPSARDPVPRKHDLPTHSGQDAEEEKVEEPKSHLENSDPIRKGNGSWVEVELSSTKPSHWTDKEGAHQTPRKSPPSAISNEKFPPFEDIREVLESGSRQVASDKEPVEKHFPLPGKSLKGASYKIRVTENQSVEDVTSWPSPVLGSVLQSPEQRRHESTGALFRVKGPVPEQSPAHSKTKSRKAKEVPARQSQLISSSGGGGGGISSLQPNKRNFTLMMGEAELKLAGCSEAEQEEEPKELGHMNYGFNVEPVYTDPDAGLGKPVEVGIVTDLVSYKDDHHMYQFDYGHKHCYQVRKEMDEAYMIQLAESSEKLFRRGWREVFGLMQILVNLVTVFLIEVINFLSKSIFQVLTVGLMTAVGDHVIKPFLVALFNSVLQPLLIFLLNVVTSLRNLTYPFIDVLKGVSLQVAMVLQAFRLVEVHTSPRPPYNLKV